MCMGMMNYREIEGKFTTISCKSCGRTWFAEKAFLERFNNHFNGLCSECRKQSKGKVSLLKKNTNFEALKNLSAWDFAGKIDDFVGGDCDICPFSSMKGDVQECLLLDEIPSTCRQKYTQWLESEAKE